MKKLLSIFFASITFMACTTGTGQKQQTTVFAKGDSSTIFTKDVDSFFIDYQTGVQKVQNWQNFISQLSQQGQPLAAFANSSAFVIPASTIKYLLDVDQEDYVVFYLALNNTKDTLSLVYQGGKKNISQTGDTVIEFTPVKTSPNGIFAMDNTWPCPVCPVDGFITKKGRYTVPYRHTPRLK